MPLDEIAGAAIEATLELAMAGVDEPPKRRGFRRYVYWSIIALVVIALIAIFVLASL